jgi:hypothetical protein
MKFRHEPYFTPFHFHILKGWWEGRKCGVPDPQFFPPTGLVVFGDDQPICAGFLFKTDAKIGVINHVVSSPEKMFGLDRDHALSYLIAHLIQEARTSDLKMVTAACNMKKMQDRYEGWGFTKADTNEVHFGRLL